MQIIKAPFSNDDIKKTADVLLSGGVVIYPSSSSYGIGVDALNKRAVKKIYSLKRRGIKKPLSLACLEISMIEKIATCNKETAEIIKKYWRKKYTFILPVEKKLPTGMYAENKEVGIRTPDSKIVKNLLKEFGGYMTTTSANIAGQPEIYSVKGIETYFGNDSSIIDIVLDAGDLPISKTSTVVDLTQGPENIKTLRK